MVVRTAEKFVSKMLAKMVAELVSNTGLCSIRSQIRHLLPAPFLYFETNIFARINEKLLTETNLFVNMVFTDNKKVGFP